MGQITIEQLRDIMQKAENAAFGLHENGGSYAECDEIKERAAAKVRDLLGVKCICYGCGMHLDKCICAQVPSGYAPQEGGYVPPNIKGYNVSKP